MFDDGLILLIELVNNFCNQYWEGESKDGVLLDVPDNFGELITKFILSKLKPDA